jgi:DNA-binding protein HU-beta/integration host factor subunit alpha
MSEKKRTGRRAARRVQSLTKRELVLRISEDLGYVNQQQVFEIVQHVLDGMAEAMLAGRHIEFRDFGVFEVLVRKARIGRNPNRPQDTVTIPARKVIKFRPGIHLKAALARQTVKA